MLRSCVGQEGRVRIRGLSSGRGERAAYRVSALELAPEHALVGRVHAQLAVE